jgi:ketosteroid isomerase-like protein
MTEPTRSPILFQQAVEARDHDLIAASLAPDVVFFSPIPAEPFRGRDVVAGILRLPAAVFAFDDTFRYTTVMDDGDGLVTELKVMARPLAQIERFSERVTEILSSLTPTADAS